MVMTAVYINYQIVVHITARTTYTNRVKENSHDVVMKDTILTAQWNLIIVANSHSDQAVLLVLFLCILLFPSHDLTRFRYCKVVTLVLRRLLLRSSTASHLNRVILLGSIRLYSLVFHLGYNKVLIFKM